MTSHFETSSHRFHRFEQVRARLSDDLVSRVLPRGTNSKSDDAAWGEGGPSALLSQQRGATMQKYRDAYMASCSMESPRSSHSKLPMSSRMRVAETNDTLLRKGQLTKSEIRREQCRTNQARYRNKQRNNQLRLENAVRELRQDLENLKQRRQSIVLSEKTSQSPWTIVSEVFRIIESSFRSPWSMADKSEMLDDVDMRKNLKFLHDVFTSDVAAGELTGIDGLVERWRHYSMHLGDARLQLKRVEFVAPGVMTASAKLSVVATELVMRHLFPHLVEVEPQSKYDPLPRSVRSRLLGQSLNCSISVDFYFDEENGRVARLEPKIDLLPELLRILGDLEDLAEASSFPSGA